MNHRLPPDARPVLYDHRSHVINPKDITNEDLIPYLPDLYQKKFRLIEKVERVRKEYFIDMKSLAEREHSINLQRKKTPWDVVLEEAKWVAIDMMEERKSKIAIAHYLSKKLKKQRINREINQNKVAMVHRLISSELASMVSRGFDCVYRNKQFAEKKEMDLESSKEIKREEMDVEGDGNSKYDNFIESTISYEKQEKPKKLKTLSKAKKTESRANYDSEILDVEKVKTDNSTADINLVFKNASSIKKQLLENMFNTAARTVEQNLEVKSAQPSDIQNVIYQKRFKINRALCVKELQRCLKKYKNKVSNEPLEILTRIKDKDTYSEFGVDPLKSLQIAPEVSMRDPGLASFALTREISTISTSAISKEDTKLKKPTSTTIPAPNPKETAAQNARVSELFLEGAYTFNFKDLKKIRDKENSDELLILFYEDPINEGDYESMFKISIENNKAFPSKVDAIPLEGFGPSMEKNPLYSEPSFNDKTDNVIYKSHGDLESFSCYIRDKMLELHHDGEILKKNPPERLNHQDFIKYLPRISDELFFYYQKEGIRWILKRGHPQIDRIQWPPIVNFLIDHYVQRYGNRWNLICDFLSMNLLSKGSPYIYSERVVELKWLANQTENRKKLFNLERKRLPFAGNSKASTSSSENRNGYMKEEKKEGDGRFKFKRLQKSFKGYLDQKPPSGQGHLHSLFFGIKAHLKTEQEVVQMPSQSQIIPPKELDSVTDLRRIALPETMNREIHLRYKGAEPPLPQIKKSRVSYSNMGKLIEEIATLTGNQMQQQQQQNSQVHPMMNQPNAMPGQNMIPRTMPGQPGINNLSRMSSGGSQPPLMNPSGMRPNMQPPMDGGSIPPHGMEHSHGLPHPSGMSSQQSIPRGVQMMSGQQPPMQRHYPPTNPTQTQPRQMMPNPGMHGQQMMGGVPTMPTQRMGTTDPNMRMQYNPSMQGMSSNVMGGQQPTQRRTGNQ